MSKQKQKPKPGKVIRINPQVELFLKEHREPGETWSQVIERLAVSDNDSHSHMWTLPSKLVPTEKEAIGQAIVEAAKEGISLKDREVPVKVFEG